MEMCYTDSRKILANFKGYTMIQYSFDANKSNLENEILRRRTFAIISHPDAGKTTMTEKLLLYGGAIHLAGSVKARKANRHATSDWMEIEKQRGISVTSSVMQFNYQNFCINILDTPGHQDFSEDTYRTLCAADAAIMLIDGAKGVEPQTIKLFHVCRKRGIPIFTFINKMDRAARSPFDLMDELEKVLGIRSSPINWPIGTDGDFKGVFNRLKNQIELYDSAKQDHGASQVVVTATDLQDPHLEEILGPEHYAQLQNDIELLDIAGDTLDETLVAEGKLTPLFFGSAINNFGVEPFLQEFLRMAPPPSEKKTNEGNLSPYQEAFSGFVFKIQANMNPDHRDRMAFIRVCSGRYSKEMEVKLARENKKIRLTAPQQLMAQERASVEEAYAGDILGVFDPGLFRIGDTLTTGNKKFHFEGIPVFPPEHFARISPKDSLKRKQFVKGMEQLAQEGALQLYKQLDIGTETYIVGVVGVLQFEVLEHRLQNEYGVALRIDRLNYRLARTLAYENEKKERLPFPLTDLEKVVISSTSLKVCNQNDEAVLLFETPWAIEWARERNKNLLLLEIGEGSTEKFAR